jgi:hypothetical protein
MADLALPGVRVSRLCVSDERTWRSACLQSLRTSEDTDKARPGQVRHEIITHQPCLWVDRLYMPGIPDILFRRSQFIKVFNFESD